MSPLGYQLSSGMAIPGMANAGQMSQQSFGGGGGAGGRERAGYGGRYYGAGNSRLTLSGSSGPTLFLLLAIVTIVACRH